MVNKPQPKAKKLMKKLKSRFRLTVLNEKTFEEQFTYSLTPLNLIVLLGGFLVVFGTLFYLLVAYTPIKTLLPGYSDASFNTEAMEARLRVDSLTEAMREKDRYLADFRVILSGGKLSNMADTGAHRLQPANLNYQTSEIDESLRAKITEEDRFSLQSSDEAKKTASGSLLYRPVNGTISNAFDPKAGHYGIDIIAPKEDPVKAVLDGTIVFAGFTADGGNVIHIQHDNNMISVYKHNSALLKKSGDRIKAGESIAFIGNSGEYSEGPHLHFELWENGAPVNPTDYIQLN
jgi:murein DD-endopeptidase MepM/ murein hydrolase activator NlpD